MLIKLVIILFLIIIFSSLISALYFLVHDKDKSTRMVKALTIRISLSLILFILLIVAFGMGWITPHQL